MFSKFDTNIQSDELTSYEPTAADWEEYNAWLEEQEAPMPLPEDFQLTAPEGWDDDADDSIGELDTIDWPTLMEDEDPSLYPQEPWDDDYSDYDPVDMYAAEWENYALRDWD